jgi:hypothetical protein
VSTQNALLYICVYSGAIPYAIICYFSLCIVWLDHLFVFIDADWGLYDYRLDHLLPLFVLGHSINTGRESVFSRCYFTFLENNV